MEEKDRGLEAFKTLHQYLRGALWWAVDGLIEQKQPEFVRRPDRTGHPLLSVAQREVKTRADVVPMLVGTSGQRMREAVKRNCVPVKGMVREDPLHVTYFGGIVEPGLYTAAEMLDGVTAKGRDYGVRKDGDKLLLRRSAWHVNHLMRPNSDKPRVDAAEMKSLDGFCKRHNI